jgi:hypothetical protein
MGSAPNEVYGLREILGCGEFRLQIDKELRLALQRVECRNRYAENGGMHLPGRVEVTGRIENGVVVLEGATLLPEGARVCVLYPAGPRVEVTAIQRPVVLPIFPYEGPPDLDLTNDRIAEVLDRDDASA